MDTVISQGYLKEVKGLVSRALSAPAAGKYKWWHGVLALAAVTIVGVLQSGRKTDTRKMYKRKNEQASWAPPAWLFGPAWTVNNIMLLWGLIRILNDKSLSNRTLLLGLQGGIWGIYLSFGYVYFRKGSTILAEVWTQTDAILATASLVTAMRSNREIALAYLPLFVWTWYASSVSAYQVLKNPDPYFHTAATIG
ncbi:MAG: tryptophan-rich sensory protein [Bacteroidetes bacterium]|nr:tryptophan-rich sensory protein [Bacteroidota bacterium]